MKLFSTLLMSLAVSASAYAGAQLTPKVAPIPQSTKYATLNTLRPLRQAAFQLTDKEANLAQKHAMPNLNAMMTQSVKQAQSVSADVIEVTYEAYTVDWYYTPETQDWYCALNDGNMLVCFDVFSDDAESPVGHYTVDDVDHEYAYAVIGGAKQKFVSLDLDVTQGACGYDIDGTFDCSNGNTYHVVLQPGAYVPQNFVVENAGSIRGSYFSSQNDWYIKCVCGQYSLFLDLVNSENPGQLAGTYTENDIIKEYTYLEDKNTDTKIAFETLNLEVTGEDPNVACTIKGTATSDKGDHISINLVKDPPFEPKEKVDVEATITELSLGTHSEIKLEGADKTFNFSYDGSTGNFTSFSKLSGMTDAAGNFYGIDRGTLAVSVDPASFVTSVVAEIVYEDSIQYNIKGSKTLEIAGQESIICDNLEITNLFGLIYYYIGSDENGYTVQGAMYNAPDEGDFTEDMVMLVTKDGETINSLFNNSVVLSLDENGYWVLDADFIGLNMIQYTTKLYFTIPEVTEEREFVSTEGLLSDLTTELGAIQISVNSTDWFSVILEMDELTSGHYTEMSTDYKSYCNIVLDQYAEAETFDMYSVDFELEADEDNQTFVLVGTCQAGTIKWNVFISGVFKGSQTGNEYDMQEDVTINFTADAISEFGVKPGNYAYITANDGVNLFSTLIYIDGEELPAGTYPITSDYTPGTAQAGDVSQGLIYPTYCCTVDEDGYVNVPLFICVDGTVTISYDAAGLPIVVCDATNTYGYSAHIEVNNNGTGIESVDAIKATKNGKFYENNSFIFRNNGQQYNVFGQQMK